MSGREKCIILKEIRKQIATENDIPLVVEECRYQGYCKGTCPRCEAELQELERQLRKRRINIGIGLGIAAAGTIALAAGSRELVADLLSSITPTHTQGIVEAPAMLNLDIVKGMF